jgi:hypothetical protein
MLFGRWKSAALLIFTEEQDAVVFTHFWDAP